MVDWRRRILHTHAGGLVADPWSSPRGAGDITVSMDEDSHTTCRHAWTLASRACRGFGRRGHADRHRVDYPGHLIAGCRARRSVGITGRGDPRPRARAYSSSRFPGEPAADACRDDAVLSPGRVVAVGAYSRGTR